VKPKLIKAVSLTVELALLRVLKQQDADNKNKKWGLINEQKAFLFHL
jgi:hypothetical protein